MRYKGLRRRTVRKKRGGSVPKFIVPRKAKKSFGETVGYRYFCGHVVREVAKQLPNTSVICWKTDHALSLPVCAMHKFVREKTYCKKCPLFQKDEYADMLRLLIVQWEQDDLILEE